ncbi:ribosomal RNA small subunit methyltransferase A [Candidatus Nomurabacteria bacterium CG10_big_fil_rev_8_21_14_0_10_35_16]|uniref:Ribosomal RNA small subunit methyltransferase A n=1 Tax=Candidatus Nomurabacteria bacterium CG10_big_fil_rev_8_21_14_0_10_35_16 TaxID=1974731 RepID=A0A2H0TBF0_9BACT|nr:MAG: ribosomal RNA small subunit methyltransferase A [Candidatus Nomurabacteria bacterium CG10_big_fil_rev_8_21_14_0_10_35_16]
MRRPHYFIAQENFKHRVKKSLGQNFLKSENILRKIVEAGEVNENDIVLEIGPGKGALTEKLLEKVYSAKAGRGYIVAVEKDNQLFEFLQEKFAEEIKNKKLILINDDILDINISATILKFFSGPRIPGSLSQPDHSKNLKSLCYKIIANIPYNITGAILKKFLTDENQPSMMVLTVQHEVAQRILAKDAKESILSISVKAYGEPKMVMKVDKRYFSPAPRVNSAVIAIKNISRKIFTSPQPSPYKGEGNKTTVLDKTWNSQAFEEKFWEIVKKGFAHKRKKLSGNLKKVISDDKLTSLGLQDKRAENLTLKDWILLTK